MFLRHFPWLRKQLASGSEGRDIAKRWSIGTVLKLSTKVHHFSSYDLDAWLVLPEMTLPGTGADCAEFVQENIIEWLSLRLR